MRHYSFILLSALIACVACQVNTDDNKTLDYDSIQVNFSATLEGREWTEGTQIGVIATCTRDGQENYVMSESPVGRYTVASSGETSLLVAGSESDKAVALASDHNYYFYGIYPYPGSSVNLSSINVSVPAVQDYSVGVMGYLTFLSRTKTLTVLPTVSLDMNTMFSILSLYVPNDLREGFESTLTKVEITPSEGSDFSGYLAQAGSYNAITGVFSELPEASSNKITVKFGDGLPLTDTYTRIDVAVAPFTVPEGGFTATFYDLDGSVTAVPILASEKEAGTVLNPGEGLVSYVSGISDGIVPVTFPVVFPLGYPNGDNTQTGYCNSTNLWAADFLNDEAGNTDTRLSQMWTGTHGKILCKDQNQAYVTWTWDKAINDTGVKHFIELVNTASYHISTFGVKGVWTGDYFEFTIPVRKFAAGSRLKLTMPFYTRSGPTFWEVLYKDGEEWKSTAVADLPAYEGAEIKARATWALPYGGAAATTNLDTDQEVTMTFDNEIKSGIINIRVKCVDGSIISSGANAVKTVTTPLSSSGKASAPFYFWNPNSDKRATGQAITIELL